MKSRKTTLIPQKAGNYNSVTTLTHEFGHVWGLCDMYALKSGGTNCDPDHSTVDHDHKVVLVDESIMSHAKGVDDLFLSDDDISGIKKLDRRVDLDQIEWTQLDPAPEYGEAIIPLSERYHFEVKSIKETSALIDLQVGIYSTKAIKINILEKTGRSTTFRRVYSFDFPSGAKNIANLKLNGFKFKRDEILKITASREGETYDLAEFSNGQVTKSEVVTNVMNDALAPVEDEAQEPVDEEVKEQKDQKEDKEKEEKLNFEKPRKEDKEKEEKLNFEKPRKEEKFAFSFKDFIEAAKNAKGKLEKSKRKAAEEAKRKAAEEAKRKAAKEAKRKAAEEAKRKAAKEAKRKAAKKAKRKVKKNGKKEGISLKELLFGVK